ncbi:MAG: GNAT family N-acetyltransferase [Chloroflexi bacterium]|nr:GNAT family N-acetyltransferase [Chloroflexota bacterium]
MDGVDDLELGRRMMVHEAEVQRNGSRELRDLGDGWLLHDPGDAEPFWNRLVAPVWPAPAMAFEHRLDEVVTLFSTLDRIPHVRPSPIGNEPSDLTDRLLANGFERVGEDLRMVLRDPEPCLTLATRFGAPAPAPGAPGSGRIRVARHPGAASGPPRLWASEASLVLAEAFDVDPYRRAALEADLLACASRPECSVLIVFDGDEPVATARRMSTPSGSYLSSIGTRPGWRGRGHGALATALAVMDSLEATAGRGGDFVHLAVDVRNQVARRLYERLGFQVVGAPVADLLAR